jgi:lipoyl(octanoyl) transferase
MKKWRLIDTGSNDCYSNMAIDEALLESYTSVPVFRIYAWKPAAFSIGFSQDPDIELELAECKRSGIDFVRRMTGGGIIFHDTELTYSIVCSGKDMEKVYFAKEAYKILCSFLIKAYQGMGLDAGFSLVADRAPKSGWVCFKQKERYDIVIDGIKIGGNAQRRKRGLIFQHGSIPLKLDPGIYDRFLKNKALLNAAHSGSLSQIMKTDIGYDKLRQHVVTAFKKSFDAEFIHSGLNPDEKKISNYLLESKYNTEEWNFCRNVNKDKALVA